MNTQTKKKVGKENKKREKDEHTEKAKGEEEKEKIDR